MSPATLAAQAQASFPDTGLHIMGIASQYPDHAVGVQEFREFVLKNTPRTPIIEKLLVFNESTGIDTRHTISELIDPISVNSTEAPTIDQLSEYFLKEGVKIAAAASSKAIEEWGGDVSEITHVIAVTCTNSANPGYDYYVARELGLKSTVERTLLHGVGCAGGLAALRNAANIALGATFLNRPARILIVACELTSLLIRSELDLMQKTGNFRIGAAIFSDCASAAVLSNGIGESPDAKPVYDLLGWDHLTVPETSGDIGFDIHPHGWNAVLTPKVPAIAAAGTPPVFGSLLSRIPSLAPDGVAPAAADFDWAVHPGGAKVLLSVGKVLGLPLEHLRASWDIYKNRGNSSSATILSVMHRLREPDMGEGRENVVAVAFGPSVAVEMCILKRVRGVAPHADVAPASVGSSDSE
ncbi:uncharacterized protein PHACADRAFT_249916 [Phanerochaete carnosa HHB-10118-sp]|uniref:Chalcone synthase n=1 Tax=Phanerochaete carnosa (strain HHB-10118-sp) TaxID=650164 RepID=K5V9D4_PHACS|nr:uncharacterized protein PHACADRAFT_249916 [Phanerochaete carnosa HHB-10118-sp]EKM59431.1 hypothetical protein PHACADRAFT_249916 [Phanerochaete carnosa HHB-10118-sp]